MRGHFFLAVAAISVFPFSAGFAAAESALDLQVIGTRHPSSFESQLWVHVENPTYAPLFLGDLVTHSQLFIDGKPSHWIADSFNGPPGLSPGSDWSTCLPMENYAPMPTEGKHKVKWMLGNFSSKEIEMVWRKPLNWRAGTMKTRVQEVKDLADSLPKGLPRSCVETWLNERDGGAQEEARVRYYLEPQIKVLVPYATAPGSSEEAATVSGAAKVYQEPRSD